ncbi:MAG: carbohydrate kinase [Alsobacter sp.]
MAGSPDDLAPQERAVLNAISANPFVGQQEVADALGLARSTVAAHIVSLVQKGHILGRGYVLPKARHVVCIGGATVDRTYHARAALVPETSNPVDGRRGFGGVARNVAENLARLGLEVALVTALGEDEAGESVARHLAALGVDLSRSLRAPDRPTAEYVAVLEPGGDLALGLADMGILDLLTPDVVERAWPHVAAAEWVFADCNLSPQILALLASRRTSARYRLAVDGVSTPKIVRLPPDLSGLDVLFLNLDEARALAALPGAGPPAAIEALLRRGAGAVVMTQGREGALVATAAGLTHVPAAPAATIDVTGAGDALVAGALSRLHAGETLVEAVRAGVVAAALATESPFSVHPDLSSTLLAARLARPEPAGAQP